MSKTLWPELPYDQFNLTRHLLHMIVQMVGKLKLATPFEPHWSNVPLWVTSDGLTTGPIPHHDLSFSVDINFIRHTIVCINCHGKRSELKLETTSVAKVFAALLNALHQIDVNIIINPLPQEVPNPIPFTEDTERRLYDEKIAFNWWRIVLSSYQVMERYRAKFRGITPPIGLMWGTFDLRDARYTTIDVPTTGVNAGYLRRNAMDVAQIECGWWGGDERYHKAAFYSFTYPAPDKIETAKIMPAYARWNAEMGEFILDYDDLRQANNPAEDLLQFLESTYEAGASLSGWDKAWLGSGVAV